ncbi:putative DNA primase/helicase [Treponema bryantii]|uniref:Putative DNA primase/helicase n=1 Tax=Treponema bryantii TaxID=163 RepID=A0A1H9IR13_9SPIR|nr:phage/plasmid primase, P4 family [Treponema bryantii]SEQ76957.1 putative DNA primase/helicase [Treponema bryantii]
MSEMDFSKKERAALEEIGLEMKANKYVKGEMQFTDLTNTLYFLRAYQDIIRYCKTLDKFLVWNGTNWELDVRGFVEERIPIFIHQMYRIQRYIPDQLLKQDFEKHLIKSESFRRIQAIIGLLKMQPAIKVIEKDLDTDNYLFNVDKLTLNLKTGKAKEPNIKHLITKKSNFIYDKDADCPTWKLFLMQIFEKDESLIRYIQKACGYALSGDVSEQCLFILWGTGANGKSTFLNVLLYLFGDYACTTMIDTFMKKTNDKSNDIARLKGLRFVTTSEIEQGKQINESLMKSVTGEDSLTARFLYGEYFSFKPTFKIFMATNHKPKIRGADNGIWRRIKMIPFTVTIPPEQRDKKLTEKLIAENSGILNWLIAGYAMWKKEGLGEEPEVVRAANEEYRMDMDAVGTFINDCLELDASLQWRLHTKILYETYMKWCNKNNEHIMSQKWLSLRMGEKGFKRLVSNSQRWWLGLTVKPEWRGFVK